ncbi:hypothetical protein [Aliiruegeria sabulilitoris]|uniref:hypothetical protein n=1 Tax=Aliiruegeria sabulilitoris TaxID=1510458 RepID=UPI000829D68E|nr:hypothetical protein [Aliiruegeria sabulilitoris]NDR55657.1 hypothetical protein [Pseudoruegeria sp. M32A2M]
MTEDKDSGLERFRKWCERWDSTVGVVVGLVAMPGLMLAAAGLWLQYDQLIEAERDTARQFQLIERTVSELSRQTALEVGENTAEASEKFFEKRGNPAYEALFEGLETANLGKLTPVEVGQVEASLAEEFSHFQSTWQGVLNCVEPHCKVFDMLHEYHVQDICAVATDDAQRLGELIRRMPDFEDDDQVVKRVRLTVLGDVMCLCPRDWATWGSDASPYCSE